ncbi:Protein of unknown function [Ruegeria halocynthiae]|uniref:DUF2927 domain-containing protein n=1 Tax=Ruegeria halocynthiae TaxID=985054 RepID=A0A1H2SI51_9RHOB|nr:DUF2927 domain-containing protein [Ruegeria halocynthiae]SDW31291.1 Protein of unknown function [Ruegeria halocynthiae]
MRLLGVTLLLAALSACTTVERIEVPTRTQVIEASLPPSKSFGATRPSPPARSNRNIAADFLSLHFALESGAELPVFTRFDGPVTVRLTGTPPPSMQTDLSRLLTRLQREARIDIRQIPEGQANITIEAVSQKQIRRILPQAACFVVPNSSSLEEYRRDRRKTKSNWTELRNREQIGIFIPYDASPQEIRDCLHEELAQALGPLNDLYRLPDSVFNDDNFHTVLTGFDMLILRTAYAPELQNGMTREQVAAVLPGVLSRLNPRGDRVSPRPVAETPRDWINAVQRSLGASAGSAKRLNAANEAARIGQQQGWTDHRRAYPHYLLGRMAQFEDPEIAQQQYDIAMKYLKNTPGTEIQRAHVTAQTAAFALAQGQGADTLPELNAAINVMTRAENAALLATLLLLKSEVLRQSGQMDQARNARLDSIGWARYGFGSELVVRSVSQDIAQSAATGTGG